MPIRKLPQVLLTSSLMVSALFCSTAFAQEASSHVLPFVPSRVTERVTDANRVILHGNTHPMARKEFDLGPVEASLPMERIMMVLQRSPEQQEALDAFDARLYDPSSPDFHHWMRAEEFGKSFGPSDADLATVTGWLESHGFQVGIVSKGRVSIEFTGTAAQVQEAFHTEIHKYMVNGVQHIANSSDPEIPAALAPVVKGISTMSDFRHRHQSFFGDYVRRDRQTGVMTIVKDPSIEKPLYEIDGYSTIQRITPAAGQGPVVTPQLGYSDGNGYTVEDLTPYDVATIYNILPLWNAGITGKGVTIAIVGVSDIKSTDVNTFRSSFGLPAITPTYILNGPDPGYVANGGQGENTEDVEMAGSTAPGAAITMVISKDTTSTGGDQLSASYIVDNNTAPVVSGSFGECELGLGSAGNSFFNNLWQQAASQGQSVFYSSGDQGSAGCTGQNGTAPYYDTVGLQVNGMASSPYITSVGGTDVASWLNGTDTTYWNTTNTTGTLANAKGYMPETVWNTTCTNPLLLNVYASDSNGDKFPNNEALCNAAANGLPSLDVISAGSGGVSHCTTPTGTTSATCAGGYAKPSYQTGTGVPADGKRDVPDVSLFASYGFRADAQLPSSTLLICQASNSPQTSCDYSNPSYITYQQNGGTSAASPLTAGIMALVLQKTGTVQGLANPVFYSLANKDNRTACNSDTVASGNACNFHDITDGTNAQLCGTGDPNCVTTTSGDAAGVLSGYAAGVGYDQATGLGTPNVTNLVNNWPMSAASATLSFTPTSLAFPSTTVGSSSAAMSVTVKNTGTTSATFTSIALTGSTAFGHLATTCPSPLAAGASCTATATFTPTAAGAVTGTIVFTDSATGSPQSVGLSGTGTASAALTVMVSPSTLTFASTTVGSTTAAQMVTVKNTSTSAVTLGTIGFTGAAAGSYLQSAKTCTTSLAASASCTISVEFKPTAAGTLSASLSIADNATGSPQLVALSGTGTAAALTVMVSPSTLTFASTTVGSTTAAQIVTVKNASTSAVTLGTIGFTGAAAGSYLQSATTCTTSLAASASCTISVEFKPTAAGTLSASLSIADNATGSPQLVALSGTGTASSAGLTITKSLTFASTTVGTSAATQMITLTNSTGAAVTFTATTTISGANASSFAKTASTCVNPLAAGASCTNTITFTPQSTGALTATVNYTDSASTTTQTVALSGTGASANKLTITPSLTFPSTAVGTSAATQMITLTNSTGAAVTFTATTTISGANASSFAKTASTCTNPLPAGASCTNTITFTPQSSGTLTAMVNYTDSSSSTVQTAALSGTGASSGGGLTITPGSVTFASTTVGTSAATQMITLTNSTGAAVTFTASTTITGAGAGSFAKTASTCVNPLAAGASCTNTITFTPQTSGALAATVTYTDSASASPQTVSLFGTGTAAGPGLTITPGSLTFASTAVGTSAATQMITLMNPTTTAVTFTASTTITGTGAGSFAKTASTCVNPLAAGASCTNTITFTPTAAGALAATVTYTDSAAAQPQTVALSGTGH